MHTATLNTDASFLYINALYYQTRKNRFGGCDKEKLRKHLGLTNIDAEILLNTLTVNGWISDNGSSVQLTPDGWQYVLAQRQGKTHASICFTAQTELSPEREAAVFRFDYVMRDRSLRQSSKSITVSIAYDLCREWDMRSFETGDNNPALIRVLRRYALDHITSKLSDGNLASHERLQLGSESLQRGCRYRVHDLLSDEAWEYEVEWTMHRS